MDVTGGDAAGVEQSRGVFAEVQVSRAQAIMIGRVWIGYASFLSESAASFNLIPTMHTTISGLDASLLRFLLPPTTFNV